LFGERRAMGDMAEMLGDVPERGDSAELAETGRGGQQRRAHDGGLAPSV
jgi:hypothetical protein